MDKRPDCAMNRLIDEYDMLPPGCTVVCAVSGGADSICLLHRLNQLRAIRPLPWWPPTITIIFGAPSPTGTRPL